MAKTIIISITTIICTLLVCFTILKCSAVYRYVSYDGTPCILDHQTGKIYHLNSTNQKIIETDLPNNTITYKNYETTGSLGLDWDKIQINSNEAEKQEYFEKVKNGTNTSYDDYKAERLGWLDEE